MKDIDREIEVLKGKILLHKQKIQELNDGIPHYTGGDMTGTEYVIQHEYSDIYGKITKEKELCNSAYARLCALKLKSCSINFWGSNISNIFTEEALAFFEGYFREAMGKISAPFELLSEALDSCKIIPEIEFQGKSPNSLLHIKITTDGILLICNYTEVSKQDGKEIKTHHESKTHVNECVLSNDVVLYELKKSSEGGLLSKLQEISAFSDFEKLLGRKLTAEELQTLKLHGVIGVGDNNTIATINKTDPIVASFFLQNSDITLSRTYTWRKEKNDIICDIRENFDLPKSKQKRDE